MRNCNCCGTTNSIRASPIPTKKERALIFKCLLCSDVALFIEQPETLTWEHRFPEENLKRTIEAKYKHVPDPPDSAYTCELPTPGGYVECEPEEWRTRLSELRSEHRSFILN